MKPKFTDQYRYPNGYRPAAATNVAETIAREFKRIKLANEAQAKADAEAAVKVKRLKVGAV